MLAYQAAYFNDEGEHWYAGKERPTPARLALKAFLAEPGAGDPAEVRAFLTGQGWGADTLLRALESSHCRMG
jgi:hypothetical protein